MENVQQNLKSLLLRSRLWSTYCSGELISAGAVTSQWKFKNNCGLIAWMYTFFISPPWGLFPYILNQISFYWYCCLYLYAFAVQTTSNYFTFPLIINFVRQFNCYEYSNIVCFKRELKIFRSLTKCYEASHVWDLSADFSVLNINDLLCS